MIRSASLLLLLFFTSCRNGHFETENAAHQESRLKIELTTSELSNCLSSKENLLCFQWQVDFNFYDLVEKQNVLNQSWEVQLESEEGEILDKQELKLDNTSQLSWTSHFEIPIEHQVELYDVFLKLSSRAYGEFLYRASLDLTNLKDHLRHFHSLRTKPEESRPAKFLRQLQVELVSSRLEKISSVSRSEEEVWVRLVCRLEDVKTGIPLQFMPYSMKAVVPSDSTEFDTKGMTNSAGEIDFVFPARRLIFDHEVQKKVRLEFQIEATLYPKKFNRFIILNLDPAASEPTREIFTPRALLQDNFWRTHERRYASQRPPELRIETLEMVELPIDDLWVLNHELSLKRRRHFLFDISIYLEKEGFERTKALSLRDQKLQIRIGRAEVNSEDLIPSAWHSPMEQTVSISDSGRLSFQSTFVEDFESEQSIGGTWYLLEASLFDFSVIPPSFHLISRQSRFSKNVPAHIISPSILIAESSDEESSTLDFEFNALELPIKIAAILDGFLTDTLQTAPSLTRREANEVFQFLKQDALRKGIGVEPREPFDLYWSFKTTRLIDYSLISSEHISADDEKIDFKIQVLGRPCLSFINSVQHLKICDPDEREWTTEISYILRHNLHSTVHRVVPQIGMPHDLEAYREPSWIRQAEIYSLIFEKF